LKVISTTVGYASLTLWHPLLLYGYSCNTASCARSG